MQVFCDVESCASFVNQEISFTEESESYVRTDAPFSPQCQFVCRRHAKKIQVAASCLPRFDRWQFDASFKQNGRSNRSKDVLSRTSFDYEDHYITGHRVFSTYTPAILSEEVTDVVMSNQKSRELLLRMFPRLVSDPKQRKQAGLYALILHQHFRVGLPASQISAGLDPRDYDFEDEPEVYDRRVRNFDKNRVPESRIEDVIENLKKAFARFNAPPKHRGRPKRVPPTNPIPADDSAQEAELNSGQMVQAVSV